MSKLKMAVLPDPDGSAADVARRAGAEVVGLDEAEALAWTTSATAEFPAALPDSIRWVQLPSAGVEQWLDAGIIDDARTWTAAIGAYAAPVAEHALLLLLAGLRRMPDCVRATTWSKSELMPQVGTLGGAAVAIIGCGSIGRALIPPLRALGAEVVAVTRSGRDVPGAARTLAAADSGEVWSQADHVVIAAPATSDTRHLVGRDQLSRMRPGAWLVNVARGSVVDTDALVGALDEGRIGGAALDVTDPEPLPDDHPLWTHPRAIITPHIANPAVTLRRGFHERLAHNIAEHLAGRRPAGTVDLVRGY
ncbi:D-isomer specific 2-hydroxyacid dehydrogenase family protein [Saccharopolyspora sp. TS4A08]|uniref:D-isomer specific 2-hydroxyacid dehydrogenase family protein n=1 Tax=Saccharopolyspora ipomoeae TaxID=3042027 RepID=A0ABT6PTR9_9PSEU|nr:D-isomer specific 2-hydroxyacid dehydrogenase family protein [Saccharopolyspora sp. TS4A08]MDI2031400.1 D-isomer specific 2-hydroxyacid dehydrogenase family protein [Saccharopolyspora sp. TS4A08]